MKLTSVLSNAWRAAARGPKKLAYDVKLTLGFGLASRGTPEWRAEVKEAMNRIDRNPADASVMLGLAAKQIARLGDIGLEMADLAARRGSTDSRLLNRLFDDLKLREKGAISPAWVLVGAAVEIRRRYEEDYIPAAGGDAALLKEIKARRDEIAGRADQIVEVAVRLMGMNFAAGITLADEKNPPSSELAKLDAFFRSLKAGADPAQKLPQPPSGP
jgi:hypothetical protein